MKVPGFSEPMISHPNPEVVAKAKRRRFTADYKERILAEADQASALGPSGLCFVAKACIRLFSSAGGESVRLLWFGL